MPAEYDQGAKRRGRTIDGRQAQWATCWLALRRFVRDAQSSASEVPTHAAVQVCDQILTGTLTLIGEVLALISKRLLKIAIVAGVLVGAGGLAMSAQDKYTLKVPGGLEFSEFKGYEGWQVVSISQDGPLVAAILANPIMIDAYLSGIPGNGTPFPDGARMAKIHWTPKKLETFPAATVPGAQHDVDFMVKDSKRFADSGGWGYAVFEYDAASDAFTPGTLAATPPQGNDAKCGFACHTIVKARDYVFTQYSHR